MMQSQFIAGAAVALAVERIFVWLASMAAVGVVVAYQAEMRRLKQQLAADWIASGP